MADTTLTGVIRYGVAGSRPAANTVAKGTIYCATDTNVISQSDASTWTTILTGGAGAGSITSSGYTMNTGKLLGRSTASSGAIEEITVGSNLTLSGGTLSASGGGGASAPVNAESLINAALLFK